MEINKKVNIKNKKAHFNYELIDQYQAGIVLLGTEIKSIRMNRVSITESFCQFKKNELYIINMMIQKYEFGTYTNHHPRRERKLLLKNTEISKLIRKIKKTGFAIIPIQLYINDKGLAKVIISIAKGKKIYDKREIIKQRDIQLNIQHQKKVKNKIL